MLIWSIKLLRHNVSCKRNTVLTVNIHAVEIKSRLTKRIDIFKLLLNSNYLKYVVNNMYYVVICHTITSQFILTLFHTLHETQHRHNSNNLIKKNI